MKVFLTGANGFIGLPTIEKLIKRGHHVLAMTRSEVGANKILDNYPPTKSHITIVRGSTEDYQLVTKIASEPDGVIHLAYNHDFTGVDRATAAKQDDTVLDALLAGLRQDGKEKPLVVASGCAGLRPASLLKPGHATLQPLEIYDDFERTSLRVQTNEKVVHAEGYLRHRHAAPTHGPRRRRSPLHHPSSRRHRREQASIVPW